MGMDGGRIDCGAVYFPDPEWLNSPHCTRQFGHEDPEHAAYGRFFWIRSPERPRGEVVRYTHAHEKLGYLRGVERVRLLNSGRVRIPMDICRLLRHGIHIPAQELEQFDAIVNLQDFLELTASYRPVQLRVSA